MSMLSKPIIQILALWIALPGTVQAQTSTFVAHVPFEFVVGGQTLPPGTYIVQRLLGKRSAQDTTGVVVLKTEDHRVYKALITGLSSGARAQQAKSSGLLFTRIEGKQYLSQVWLANDNLVHQLANLPHDVSHGEPVKDSKVVLTPVHASNLGTHGRCAIRPKNVN